MKVPALAAAVDVVAVPEVEAVGVAVVPLVTSVRWVEAVWVVLDMVEVGLVALQPAAMAVRYPLTPFALHR